MGAISAWNILMNSIMQKSISQTDLKRAWSTMNYNQQSHKSTKANKPSIFTLVIKWPLLICISKEGTVLSLWCIHSSRVEKGLASAYQKGLCLCYSTRGLYSAGAGHTQNEPWRPRPIWLASMFKHKFASSEGWILKPPLAMSPPGTRGWGDQEAHHVSHKE